jgi:mono/diheme cytochrome c family protein
MRNLTLSAAFGLILLASGLNAYAAANCTPPVLTPAEEGRRAYLRLNCYGCHGMRGTGGMGPRIIGEDDVGVVLEGSDSGMPSFRNALCPNDLNYLSAYLRSLGTRKEPTFTHWWEPIPSQ